MKNEYHSLGCLKNVYLEDSYVLRIHQIDDSLEFDIEAVLTEDHELYILPKPSEQYCYREMTLKFKETIKIEWLRHENIYTKDLDNNIDFGNIDLFRFDENKYHLSGDWGEVVVTGGKVTIDSKQK